VRVLTTVSLCLYWYLCWCRSENQALCGDTRWNERIKRGSMEKWIMQAPLLTISEGLQLVSTRWPVFQNTLHNYTIYNQSFFIRKMSQKDTWNSGDLPYWQCSHNSGFRFSQRWLLSKRFTSAKKRTHDSENNDLDPVVVWILRIHKSWSISVNKREISLLGYRIRSLIFVKKRNLNPPSWSAFWDWIIFVGTWPCRK